MRADAVSLLFRCSPVGVESGRTLPILSRTRAFRLPASQPASANLLPWGALLAGLVAGLACTNPGPQAFQDFAAGRLGRLLRQELCHGEALPLMLRLVIRDCPALIAAQRVPLGRLALRHSQRTNLGVFSLYTTELGGQKLLGSWSLPRYRSLTLALAGQFLVVQASQSDPQSEVSRQAWLPPSSW
jgi:hypothetical protein